MYILYITHALFKFKPIFAELYPVHWTYGKFYIFTYFLDNILIYISLYSAFAVNESENFKMDKR